MAIYTMIVVDDTGREISRGVPIDVNGYRASVEDAGRQIGLSLVLDAIHDAAMSGNIDRISVSAAVTGVSSKSVAAVI